MPIVLLVPLLVTHVGPAIVCLGGLLGILKHREHDKDDGQSTEAVGMEYSSTGLGLA